MKSTWMPKSEKCWQTESMFGSFWMVCVVDVETHSPLLDLATLVCHRGTRRHGICHVKQKEKKKKCKLSLSFLFCFFYIHSTRTTLFFLCFVFLFSLVHDRFAAMIMVMFSPFNKIRPVKETRHVFQLGSRAEQALKERNTTNQLVIACLSWR